MSPGVAVIAVIAFILLAGLGAAVRSVLGRAWNRPDVPLGTLGVNLVGAFALGLLAGSAEGTVATVVGTGGIGALTTFSTFAGEVTQGARRHRGAALTYALGSIAAGAALAWLGLRLTS